MAVVTVSRQLGCGGDETARGVAEVLGWRFIDREIINRAAEAAGVPDAALRELEYEGQRNLVDRILEAMRLMPPIPAATEVGLIEAGAPLSVPFGGLFTPAMTPLALTMEDYVRMVEMVILDLAREGDLVTVGRGSQVLLRDMPGSLHVQIVAPFEKRVEAMMERDNLPRPAAVTRVRTSDQARADYLRRYYNVNWLDPTLYDLVINTARVPVPAAIELIVSALKAMA